MSASKPQISRLWGAIWEKFPLYAAAWCVFVTVAMAALYIATGAPAALVSFVVCFVCGLFNLGIWTMR